jgi:hypothetical protein
MDHPPSIQSNKIEHFDSQYCSDQTKSARTIVPVGCRRVKGVRDCYDDKRAENVGDIEGLSA